MRESDPQTRQALEHAAEDQARDGERTVGRIADHEGQVVVRHPFLADRRSLWMDEHGEVEIGSGGENLDDLRIVEIAAVDMISDLDGRETIGLDPFQFRDREARSEEHTSELQSLMSNS